MRTIFIGDVHGCARELEEMLEKVEFQPDRDRLLLTGDAFSRGPAPLRVWELIKNTGAEMVMGNHDDRLLRHMRARVAGQDPGIHKEEHQYTLDRLMPAAGELRPWLEELPLWIETDTFLLVHAGINPKKGLRGTTRDEFLKIRTWPPTDGIAGPRWHDCYKITEKLLVFGHDAPGGLVVRLRPDSRPYLIGLDSGCVYGNQLSAYILEKNQIVQIKSRN